MATETDFLREAIKARGGSCDDLPDNLESTLNKKLIEACQSGGGGSGGGGDCTIYAFKINMGADEEGNFTAAYNGSTYADLAAAYEDGKVVYVIADFRPIGSPVVVQSPDVMIYWPDLDSVTPTFAFSLMVEGMQVAVNFEPDGNIRVHIND